jgi:hypothetical protein
MAAGPLTFVATKVTKVLFLFRLLYAHCLYPANQAEPRAVNSCPTAFALPHASANIYYALSPTQATKFSPISSEASCICLNQNFLN